MDLTGTVPYAPSPSSAPFDLDQLLRHLERFEAPIVALSGGLDSSVLALLIHEVHGSALLAITAVSPSLAPGDRASVEAFVARHGIRHLFRQSEEFSDERYLKNDERRCYFCKHHLFALMRRVAQEEGGRTILYGAQSDDLGDYRPGFAAAREDAVAAPFIDAGWGKDRIRDEARRRGLSLAEKPASPCLASRLAYGVRVTEERLRRVEAAEAVLARRSLAVYRVRDRGDSATIELGPAESAMPLDRQEILREIGELGFSTVSFDERGYRRGSLNDALTASE